MRRIAPQVPPSGGTRYNEAAHKHAATSATANGAPTFNMTYDADGNMITENSDTFTYNGDNQLVSPSSGGATIAYTYDGKGTLAKKSASDGTWTVYIGGVYEKHQDGSYVTYYIGLGRRMAMRIHTGPGDPGTVHFLVADHLGSTSAVLSATGTVEQSAKYYPYGSLRSGSITVTDKKFTGQQDEGTAFGLYNYGARFYSTVLGRFISGDPIGVNAGDAQSLDRYSYVLNNPLKYTDPTGLCPKGMSRNTCNRYNAQQTAQRLQREANARRGIPDASGSSSSGLQMLSADSCVNGGVGCPKEILDFWNIMRYFNGLLQAGWLPNVTDNDVSWQDQTSAVAFARAQEDKPYAWGHEGPDDFDCAGLMYWSYQQVGVDIGHGTWNQWDNTTDIDRSQLRPGDLVFYYEDTSHVAMYIGDGMIVEAPAPGGVVQERPIGGNVKGYRRPHY